MENGNNGITPASSNTFQVRIATTDTWELIIALLDYKGGSEDEKEDFCWEFRSSKKAYSPLPGVSIKYAGDLLFEAEGDLSGIVIIVGLASGFTSSYFANWLYGKLNKKKVKRLTISNREIEIDEGEIKRVVEQVINIEDE